MSREKLLLKMRNNPRDWTIEEVKTISERYEIEYRQPGTSHFTFRTKRGEKITIPAHKPVKPIYIKQFLELLDRLGDKNE